MFFCKFKKNYFIEGLWSCFFVLGFICLTNDEIETQALTYSELHECRLTRTWKLASYIIWCTNVGLSFQLGSNYFHQCCEEKWVMTHPQIPWIFKCETQSENNGRKRSWGMLPSLQHLWGKRGVLEFRNGD
jgi:hypothetical protein